jgi:hypothetical protein
MSTTGSCGSPTISCSSALLLGSDVGTAALSNTEVQRLRQYLLKGGFLWVDDFWGTPAWDQWTDQTQSIDRRLASS